MANRTVRDAQTVHGTNPQYLVEKIIRSRIYESKYWKEECFAVTAELIVDKGMDLRYCGGVYGGNIKPTPFICLLLKMLQIQPEKDIIIEFLRQEDFKYIRALAAIYLRLTATALDIYKYLEPLYNDYRKLRFQNREGAFELSTMDQFVDELLVNERACDIILPRLQKRHVLEEAGKLETRVSLLDDDNEDDEDEEDDATAAALVEEMQKIASRRKQQQRDTGTLSNGIISEVPTSRQRALPAQSDVTAGADGDSVRRREVRHRRDEKERERAPRDKDPRHESRSGTNGTHGGRGETRDEPIRRKRSRSREKAVRREDRTNERTADQRGFAYDHHHQHHHHRHDGARDYREHHHHQMMMMMSMRNTERERERRERDRDYYERDRRDRDRYDRYEGYLPAMRRRRPSRSPPNRRDNHYRPRR